MSDSDPHPMAASNWRTPFNPFNPARGPRPCLIMIVCVALLLIFVAAPATAQTIAQPNPYVHIDVDSWRLRRDVNLSDAGAETVHAVSDALVRRAVGDRLSEPNARGRWIRFAKIYLVDLPAVAVGHTLGHEAAHLYQLSQTGEPHLGIEITRWPWPFPVMDAQIRGNAATPGRARLANWAAGSEAGVIRDDRAFDSYAELGGPDYFSSAQLLYSRLEEPLAALFYLRAPYTSSTFDFAFPRNDMIGYAYSFEHARDPFADRTPSVFQARAAQMRRAATTSLADLQLVDALTRLARYAWTGTPASSGVSMRVADWRFWPRITFAMTPDGIARGTALMGQHGAMSASVEARRTETPEGPSLWSSTLRTTLRRPEFSHTVALDAWSQFAGRGGAAEYRLSWAAPSAPRRIWSASIGYKTRGFLAGGPIRANWHIGVGLTLAR